jgi:arylformamidase
VCQVPRARGPEVYMGLNQRELDPMVDQVRRAIAWTYRNAKGFGGDPKRLYVSGRSSGSHLGACAAITDWQAFGLPADAVKGYVLQSGVYDLRGPRLSQRSSCVKFTDEMAESFANPYGPVGRAALEQMKLARA